MKKLILFLILNILNPTIGNSSEFNHLKFSKETFRVAVIVSCEDKNLKEYIESHIKRELRAIGDVVIVLDKPQTTINIVAIKNKIENIDIGYSMAVTIVKTVDLSFLNNRPDKVNQEEDQILALYQEKSDHQLKSHSNKVD